MSVYQLGRVEESSPEYIDAIQIHHNILSNGTVAATAMVELCRNLKLMRDKAAFAHLGFETFDDYCEQAANIKKRQAYNYINTYERLGADVLQSNAQLGITKLQLLAQIPETAREEIIESGQADELSTRQLKELTEELTKAREQLSFLEDQKEENYKNKEEWKHQCMASRAEIVELEKQIKDLTTQLSDSLAKAKEDAAKEVKQELEKKAREKIDKELAKANADVEKKITAAREEGMKAGREESEKGIEAVEKERAAALARASELEKKLQVSGNQDTVLLTHLFSEFQNQFNKITECITKIKSNDQASGEKFQQALRKAIAMMDQSLAGGR